MSTRFLFAAVIWVAFLFSGHCQVSKNQRIVILMIDGFGEDYYRQSDMPNLNALEKEGLFKIVPGVMPAVTNVNTVSIATGELPEKHGITGNVYYNPSTGKEEYVESPELILAPTLFKRANDKGVKSVLFTVKKKSVDIYSNYTNGSTCPECPNAKTSEWAKALGTPPEVYTKESSYWMMQAAIYTLKNDPETELIFVHTTDYPMHTWAPEEADSKDFLHKLDFYIGEIRKTAPDAAILLTADHGLNHKNLCYDLTKVLSGKNIVVDAVISPEKDRYFKHHRGMGGSAYIYLKNPGDYDKVASVVKMLPGVERVLSNKEASTEFHLMPERIGDIMVLGDLRTVFGDLEKEESEKLPKSYRSHGSTYETRVPLFIFNAKNSPEAGFFDANYKIASWLYR